MNPLRRLASQTAIYGLSSVIGRFINYLLVPLYTYSFTTTEYGVVSEFYAYAGFLAVLLTFGMETGYFRFREREDSDPALVYSTSLRFLLTVNIGFLAVVLALDHLIAGALQHGDHPEYVWWFALIVALDSVGAIAFARLRAENRALHFAGVKLIEIFVAVGLNLFLIAYCRPAYETAPDSWAGQLWNPAIGIGYIFLANIAASAVKLLLLAPQLRGFTRGFDRELFARMLRYSLPMMIIGMAGVINEMLDRAALKYLLPYDQETNLAQLGIYSACYKLAVLMSLFIQAFRYAGEPFFFAQARHKDAPQTYAAVLNYFTIFCAFIFLFVLAYIDLFKYFIGEPFREGLQVVPVLLMANLLLGIYVNLSIWYKLTDRTLLGAYVAGGGAVLTIALNLWWVPIMGYMGAAWATLACYGAMTVVSYVLGRRYYPVPYDLRRMFGYLALAVALYAINAAISTATKLPSYVGGTLCLLAFSAVAYWADGSRPRPRAS